MVCRKVQCYANSCKKTFFESIHKTPVYAAEESQDILSNIIGEIKEAFFVLLHRD